MRLLGSILLLSSVALVAHGYTCPSGKSKKVIRLGIDQSEVLETQEGDKYSKNVNCRVIFKKKNKKLKCKLQFSCKDFALIAKKPTCRGGSDFFVINRKKFCGTNAPEVETPKVNLAVVFKTNKRSKGDTGAICTATCASGAATTAAPTTTAPTTGAPTTAAPTTTGGSTTAAYCALDPGHTMCLHSGPSSECAAKTILRGMTQEGKDAILAKHNDLRRRVARGEESGQPAAGDMRELVWDSELEEIAQRWADQCTFAHDPIHGKLDGTAVGQNLYIGGSSLQTDQAGLTSTAPVPAQAWYDEVTDPGFSSGDIDPFVFSYGAGHYTQVVWASTSSVGCANVYYFDGSFYQNLVVCNYAVAGNLQGGTMYTQGTACTSCPSGTSCVASLCRAD